MRKGIFIGVMVVLLLMGSFYQMVKAAELEKAERPEWKIGYKWSYKITHSAYPNKVFEIKKEVIRKEEFEKVSCYVVSLNSLDEDYITEDLNGKVTFKTEEGSRYLWREFIPEQRTFDWPLEVGKKWKAAYEVTWHTDEGYMKDKLDGEFKVTKIEKIKVLAGKFETFKIVLKVRRGEKLVVFQEWWYSPELCLIVKEKIYWPDGHIEERQLHDFDL